MRPTVARIVRPLVPRYVTLETKVRPHAMPRPLPEQVIIITGASSGIGRETAQQLARHGASLVLVARNEVPLRETAAEVEARGGRALVAPADVSDPEQLQHVADQ